MPLLFQPVEVHARQTAYGEIILSYTKDFYKFYVKIIELSLFSDKLSIIENERMCVTWN